MTDDEILLELARDFDQGRPTATVSDEATTALARFALALSAKLGVMTNAYNLLAERMGEADEYCRQHDGLPGAQVWHFVLDDAIRLRAQLDEFEGAPNSRVHRMFMETLNREAQALIDLAAARHEIAVDDQLLADRNRILDACPCPAHGRCVPYVLEVLAGKKPLPAMKSEP